MGPHTLASKFHVAVSLPLKDLRGQRVFSTFRETGIRASEVQLDNPQGVQGVNSRHLRLFLHSAKRTDFTKFLPSGIFYGVASNPILLKEADIACNIETLRDYASRAVGQGATEVHLQTWGNGVDKLADNGRKLAALNTDKRVVVKVPCTEDGLQAAKKLVKQNIKVTMTGLCSVHQVLSAIGVGAIYATPYLGRMDTIGKAGMDNIMKMQSIITAMNSDMKLLVASINRLQEVTDLAACGVTCFALKEEVLNQFLHDPLTEQLARECEEAASENTGPSPLLKRSMTI